MAFPFFGDDKSTVARLLATLPQTGTLQWIGQRPVRREPLVSILEAELKTDSHLLGDHARPKAGGQHGQQAGFGEGKVVFEYASRQQYGGKKTAHDGYVVDDKVQMRLVHGRKQGEAEAAEMSRKATSASTAEARVGNLWRGFRLWEFNELPTG